MFYAAYLFTAFSAFLVISPAAGIVGGVKVQIGQFPYIVSFLVNILNYIINIHCELFSEYTKLYNIYTL